MYYISGVESWECGARNRTTLIKLKLSLISFTIYRDELIHCEETE
jgi:hypothetical protein